MTTAREWTARGEGMLPGLLGIEDIEVGEATTMRIAVQRHHLAPNGFLHAATIVALADTACGYGCVETLPEGATGFTTLETKTNHLATVVEGSVLARANVFHSGRTTQVWDATVEDEATSRVLALFRCTQLIIYPR